MLLRQFSIDGLGHLSALIADESARMAAVVDPRRDVDVYLAAAREADLRISHVVETHLHNDYVSGGRELAALTGATHVIGAGAELAYEHRPVRHGDAFGVGRLQFKVLETPGHTPEHVAYSVADRSRADEPALLFTGGSLLVGAVGRTDLLGADNALPFARAMFRSIGEVILSHPDYVGVYPTHGAGSLCSTGISSTPNSTIGYERRHNPMVGAADVDTFARILLSGQPAFPRYFARMRPINQAGPRLLGGALPEARPLGVKEVEAAVAGGALVVDLRSPAAHATAHIPGSISIPTGSSFGTWLGWVVDHDRPLVFVLERPGDWDDAIRQALRIGHEQVIGTLGGGFTAWSGSNAPVEAGGRLTVDQLAARLDPAGSGSGRDAAPLVIDVRQLGEFADGHIPGSLHLAGGSLPDRLDELPRDRPIATVCASGYRASVAASLLQAAGFSNVSWVADGIPSWRRRGHPTETGTSDASDAAGDPGQTGEAAADPHGHHHGAASDPAAPARSG
ncbi:MAG TPA: rhodanese-like domain-containing protein [Candidatus Limnocylindrales bacterium]|nr:rhodanese-like domain-containing protein [Candidatus Limnocylindrales bacterium]